MFVSTTPNINITKPFCELHSMLLLLPTAAIFKGPPAAILEISVASEQRRGKLCHSISIQSTYFVRQFSVENVYFRFCNAGVGFSFPKIMLNPVLFLRSVGLAMVNVSTPGTFSQIEPK